MPLLAFGLMAGAFAFLMGGFDTVLGTIAGIISGVSAFLGFVFLALGFPIHDAQVENTKENTEKNHEEVGTTSLPTVRKETTDPDDDDVDWSTCNFPTSGFSH